MGQRGYQGVWYGVCVQVLGQVALGLEELELGLELEKLGAFA